MPVVVREVEGAEAGPVLADGLPHVRLLDVHVEGIREDLHEGAAGATGDVPGVGQAVADRRFIAVHRLNEQGGLEPVGDRRQLQYGGGKPLPRARPVFLGGALEVAGDHPRAELVRELQEASGATDRLPAARLIRGCQREMEGLGGETRGEH